MTDAANALASIAAAYRDPDGVARSLAAAGRRVIRTIGSDAPHGLLRAAGFDPVRVSPPPLQATPRADALIGKAGERRRTHRLLEWLLDPEQENVPILITRADSEQPQLFAALRELKRLGEAGPRNVAMLDLLHQPRESSRRYNRRRLDQLAIWLAEQGGTALSQDAISATAGTELRLRDLVLEAQKRRETARPSLNGADLLRIVGACAILPPEAMIAHLEAVLVAPGEPLPQPGRRLWLTGSAPEDDLVYTELERGGAMIVGETHDWGVSRFTFAPAPDLDGFSDPARHAPLAARSLADVARECLAAAGAAGADAVVNLVLDGDEVAPWLAVPLRDQAGDIAIESVPAATPPSPAPPSATARRAPQERSRKLLKAVADFGTFQREWFAEIRARVADGAPFAVVNANAPQEILRTFDLPFVVNQWWASIVAAKQQSGRYRGLLADHGYPASVEAYSTQALAAAFDKDPELAPWGGLPTPDFVHAIASSDPTPAIFEALARQYGAEPFLYERTVDPRPTIETRWWKVMPDGWDHALEAERIDILVEELQLVIGRIEDATGRRFDAARFSEIMELVNEQEDYYRATRDLIARTVPAPVGIVDTMPATMVPQWHRGSVWARDAARAFHDEVAARVAAGQGVVEDEKVRLMWIGRGLWSETSFYQRWEESHGAVFVWSMYLALAADGYIRRYDRGRDPLRALAARFVTMGDELRMPSWAGPWYVHEAQTHQIDGAVALSDADPFVVRALKAAGIPVLELGVDNFALRPDDLDRLNDRVTAFIEGAAGARAASRRGETA